MATLDDLLALLPDNSSGAIDADDLRTIVSELWGGTASLEARLIALEASTGEISYDGIWQFNPQVGAVPQAMQVSLNTDLIIDATWARYWKTDLTNQDMSNFIETATKIYVQAETDSANWAYYDVTGPAVDNGSWIEVPIAVKTFQGSSASSEWQRVLTVFTMPSPAVGGQ